MSGCTGKPAPAIGISTYPPRAVRFWDAAADTWFSELFPTAFIPQNFAMVGSVLNTVDDIALAQAMIRVWGHDAALRASDNACTQAFLGDQEIAGKWRRVMILIASISAGDFAQAG